ncbi:MAG: antibiotic resistance protein MarC [Bacteroidetes bacterium HGW-Bacteroidetes-17]|jgi:multiple antibiotic resistance protein|nr:MAG: antibiotic resistance protein MarC [Bacteroidetes bacterium HGW-Bacteroidetes-17]
MSLFLLTFGALFSIMNPLGSVPIFIGLTQQNTKKEKSHTSFLTSLNVLIILVISYFAGKYVLFLFGISLDSLKIAGGLIIASSGFALLTGKFAEHKGMGKVGVRKDLETRSDISLTPLAIPMLAGPGTISLLITYNQEYHASNEILIILGAMLASAASIYLILRSSQYIAKVLGASGINALSRIIGFIVIAIGIEYITSAIINIVNALKV